MRPTNLHIWGQGPGGDAQHVRVIHTHPSGRLHRNCRCLLVLWSQQVVLEDGNANDDDQDGAVGSFLQVL